MDLALNCHDGAQWHELRGFDLIVAPAPSNQWQTVTARDVVSADAFISLPRDRVIRLNRDRDRTDTWIFRTREGGKGALQILGSPSEPGGMKLRYKLLEQ